MDLHHIYIWIWPKTQPEKTRPTRPKKRPGPAGAVHMSLLTWPKTRHNPARVGPMDGGTVKVSMAMDGWRQLRNDWLLLLHHECVSRRQVVCT